MNPNDPNVPALELVVAKLGALTSELVLVGGCSVGLLITDRARPPVRPTEDVDMVTQVVTLAAYHQIQERLRACGFKEAKEEGAHIFRWRNGNLILDVMPSGVDFGHSSNRWYPEAIKSAMPYTLPSGSNVRLIAAPLFIATKFEAFQDRGQGDYGHHDIEDIVNVVDGRSGLTEEIAQAPGEVREFLKDEFDGLLANEAFHDRLPWHLHGDAGSQARAFIVVSRMRVLAGL